MKIILLVLSFFPLISAGKPNVIYILADDLGLGDLSCYGQKKLTTPNIDRIASEGIKFTAHYSGNTVCSPSRASLMTGQHPGHIYLRGNVGSEKLAALDPKMTVLPEVFKAAGYATGAFGKWGLGVTNGSKNELPSTHGFDDFVGWKSQMIAHTYYPSSYVKNGEEIPLEKGTYLHPIIMENARDFIRRNAEAKTPFFCYIPTAIPHAAMHAPKELHEKWRQKFPQFDKVIGKYGAGPGEITPDVVNPIAGFAAMMEHLDNEIGVILDLLDELGIDDNTLVIFTSDNGSHQEGGHRPQFWNSTAGLRGMKRDMHEGGIRTPMIARWPSHIKAGRETDHISAFWDILPTMAELTNQAVPAQSDGISLLPTLIGQPNKQAKHDYLYFEFTTGSEQKLFSRALRKGDWKAFQKKNEPFQLFNLKDDPFEKNNVADKPENNKIVAEIKADMEAAHQPRK